ncbi:hypothetical protein GOODEAATRI_008300 [Goodea atripinnis]|uniref:Uncharacterized protein n=1 Tax=Goodea atripinnis TaxID=208336 RepID=A0ABV0PWU5_9TELE
MAPSSGPNGANSCYEDHDAIFLALSATSDASTLNWTTFMWRMDAELGPVFNYMTGSARIGRAEMKWGAPQLLPQRADRSSVSALTGPDSEVSGGKLTADRRDKEQNLFWEWDGRGSGVKGAECPASPESGSCFYRAEGSGSCWVQNHAWITRRTWF